MEPVYLSVRELAERYKTFPNTIYDWRKRRIGPPGVHIGNRVLFRLSEVEKWERDKERQQAEARAS